MTISNDYLDACVKECAAAIMTEGGPAARVAWQHVAAHVRHPESLRVLAGAQEAVRVSAASDAVPVGGPPAGFWVKDDRPLNFECGHCRAAGFATQRELDEHARECAGHAPKCSCGLPGCARGSGVKFAGSAASTARSEAAFSTFDRAREAGLFGASGRPAERTFTRTEVLAVLKARRAMFPPAVDDLSVGRQNELTALITIFERME